MSLRDVTFAGIRLQDEAIATLTASLQAGRISQTYLFLGPPSVGRRRTALALAATLQCQSPVAVHSLPADRHSNTSYASMTMATPPVIDACGSCESCQRLMAGSHPDVTVLGPRGTEIRVDQIRDLQDNANLKPFFGAWRIFIIDPADALNESSSNCVLKILEEAPPRVVFILIATARHRLLPTIISRSVALSFPGPRPGAAREALAALARVGPEAAARALALTEGRFGLALSLLQRDHNAKRAAGAGRGGNSRGASAGPDAWSDDDASDSAGGSQATDHFLDSDVDDADWDHDTDAAAGPNTADPATAAGHAGFAHAPAPHDASPIAAMVDPVWLDHLPHDAPTLGPAQERYVTELARAATVFAENTPSAAGLEGYVARLVDSEFELHHPELLAARKAMTRQLLRAPKLPAAWPTLAAGLILGAIDEAKGQLKKSGERLLAESKNGLAPAMAKEMSEQLNAACAQFSWYQLDALFGCLVGWLGDAWHWQCLPDESLVLNIDRQNDIMALARIWGYARLEKALRLTTWCQQLLLRNVNPQLILENLLTNLAVT